MRTVRDLLLIVLVVVLGVVGAWVTRSDGPGTTADGVPPGSGTDGDAGVARIDPEGLLLVSFDDCGQLVDDLASLAVEALDGAGTPWSGPLPMPLMEGREAAADAAGGDASSAVTESAPDTASDAGTNVQVAGVDEADRAKVIDGRVVAVDGGVLRVVEVDGDAPRQVGRLELDVPADRMLVAGDRVLLLAGDAGPGPLPMPLLEPAPDGGGESQSVPDVVPIPQSVPSSTLVLVDLSDPTAPRELERLQMDGAVVAGRLADGAARLVVRAQPTLPMVAPTGGGIRGEEIARERNLEAIRSATAEDWLPWAIHTGADGSLISEGTLVDCTRVARATTPTDLAVTTLLGVDLGDGLDRGSPAAVVGGGDTVHATADAVVVAAHQPPPEWWRGADDEQRVGVHRFAVEDPLVPRWTGSGTVPGRLLGQWAIDEHDGVVRIATTTSWGQEAESLVVTLDASAEDLTELGRVSGLGPGETIQAVRFMGDTGYVVTFEQIDPLFVLDLRDPRNPSEVGELEMPGFSAYLHPVGGQQLLGVGRDGTMEGTDTGMQVSLFDVADPTAPTRVDKIALGQGWTPVQDDHHAFGWAPDASGPGGLAFVPVELWPQEPERIVEDRRTQPQEPSSQLVAVQVSAGDLAEAGRVPLDRGGAWAVRPLVVDDRLAVVGPRAVTVVDLATLEPVAEPLSY